MLDEIKSRVPERVQDEIYYILFISLIGVFLLYNYQLTYGLQPASVQIPRLIIIATTLLVILNIVLIFLPKEFKDRFKSSSSNYESKDTAESKGDVEMESFNIKVLIKEVLWIVTYIVAIYFVGFFTVTFIYTFSYIFTHTDSSKSINNRILISSKWSVGIVILTYIIFIEIVSSVRLIRIGFLP